MGEGVGRKEPNHTTARKPSPLYMIQYFPVPNDKSTVCNVKNAIGHCILINSEICRVGHCTFNHSNLLHISMPVMDLSFYTVCTFNILLLWNGILWFDRTARICTVNPTGPMYFVFCCLYPFSPSHHGSVWVLPAISLLSTNTKKRRVWSRGPLRFLWRKKLVKFAWAHINFLW